MNWRRDWKGRVWLTAGLAACIYLASSAQGAGRDPAIKTMNAVFAGLDTDSSSAIHLKEASAGGVNAKTFAAFDHDGGGSIDRSEFTLLYRQLLIDAGRVVPKAIKDEAARVCARRRLRKKGKR